MVLKYYVTNAILLHNIFGGAHHGCLMLVSHVVQRVVNDARLLQWLEPFTLVLHMQGLLYGKNSSLKTRCLYVDGE